jgi:DNA-binding transcriptional LysR family regulator
MNLRLLEIFCRVYKERSFSRAATELGLTQPTVSVHIKDLEDSLGTPVFNRLGREIEPTEAGRYLYEHARSLVTLKRNLTDKMTAFLNRVEGLLVVGASSVPGEFLLPGIMTAFHAEHPGVRVRLRISDTAETIEDLRHGDIEVGVVGAAQQDEDLLFESFASDELVLITPGGAAWRGRSEISLRELQELPLVLREPGSDTRNTLERALARARMQMDQLKVAAELGSTGAIKEAVKHGQCVSFVSRLTVGAELESGSLRIARIPELGSIERTYHVVFSRRRVLSPISRAFLDYVRQKAAARPRSPVVSSRRKASRRTQR